MKRKGKEIEEDKRIVDKLEPLFSGVEGTLAKMGFRCGLK